MAGGADGIATPLEARVVAAGTLFLALAFVICAAPQYLFTGDPDHYVGLARSLARGAGYTINGHAETKFPPGFPLILAPAALLFQGSFAAIARWAALLGAIAFPATYLLLRRRRERFALPLAIASVVSVRFLLLATGNPMSEPAYLLWSVALVYWADQWESTPGPRSLLSLCVGAVLTVGTMMTRMVGAAVVPAMMALLLWTAVRRKVRVREALPLAAGIVWLAVWMSWTRAHQLDRFAAGPDSNYLKLLFLADPANPDLGRAGLVTLTERLGNNIVLQTTHAGGLLTQSSWLKPAWYSPVMVLLPIFGIGWWRQLRSGGAFGAFYLISYLGIVLLWPFDEGGRFLIPLAPLLLLYFAEGMRGAGAFIRERPELFLRSALAWSLLALGGTVAWARLTGATHSRQDYLAAAFWLIAAAALAAPLGRRVLVREYDRLTSATALALSGAYLLAGVILASPAVAAAHRGDLPPLSTESALREASLWISANASPASIVQTTWPERLNFATGRRAVILPTTGIRATLQTFADQHPSDYLVVLDDPPFPYVSPSDNVRFVILDELFPGRWTIAATLSRARIYKAR